MRDLTSYENTRASANPKRRIHHAIDSRAEVLNRCQNCGDSKRNHKPGGACRGRLMEGKYFTPWTKEAIRAAIAKGEQA